VIGAVARAAAGTAVAEHDGEDGMEIAGRGIIRLAAVVVPNA